MISLTSRIPSLSIRDAPSFYHSFKIQSFSGLSPFHYTFKIQSFSVLSKSSIEFVSSDKFEAGEHNWKLIIYPNGDKSMGGEDHISVFLALADAACFSGAFQRYAILNLFVYNQLSDEYWSFKDGSVKCFHLMNPKCGYEKFMALSDFTKPSNGFIVDDTCVFGAEVFVLKQSRKTECLSMIKEHVTANYTWTIKNYWNMFSAGVHYESEFFTGADYRWKMRIHPNGVGQGRGNSLSLYACLEESTLPQDTRLFVKFVIRILSHNGSKHHEVEGYCVFSPTSLLCGYPKCISHARFRDPKSGFLVDGLCTIEGNLTVLGMLK